MKIIIWIACIFLANMIVSMLKTFLGTIGIIPLIPI